MYCVVRSRNVNKILSKVVTLEFSNRFLNVRVYDSVVFMDVMRAEFLEVYKASVLGGLTQPNAFWHFKPVK